MIIENTFLKIISLLNSQSNRLEFLCDRVIKKKFFFFPIEKKERKKERK